MSNSRTEILKEDDMKTETIFDVDPLPKGVGARIIFLSIQKRIMTVAVSPAFSRLTVKIIWRDSLVGFVVRIILTFFVFSV